MKPYPEMFNLRGENIQVL